jgi:uncharacterized protein YbjT (DUF2867 family)
MDRTALIAGATGLVGRPLLNLLLDDPEYTDVVALVRRPLAVPHPKLREGVVDFAELREFALPPVDDFFCCLGTTIGKAGSRAAFRAVDLALPLTIARMALAAGADPASRVFYNRVKGEVEAELAGLPFRTVVAFRPSLLAGERAEFRPGERAALAVARPLAFLLPARYRPVDAAAVARAMLARARDAEAGRFVVESDAIARLGAPG